MFFNIALNYVELDMDRLSQRAGKQPAPSPAIPVAPKKQEAVLEKKAVPKAKAEQVRLLSPEPQAPSRGGLSSLLGGWWGRS